MVYYCTSNVVDPPATLYMGKDKFENEELIKFGWDCDVCAPGWLGRLSQFHADKLSSAHVYLRLSPSQKWDQLPAALLEDCAQLTKANSIEGNKTDNMTVIYTPWSNLHKTAAMATGQVSFKDMKKTKRTLVPTRTNAIINRLEKTRTVRPADELPALKDGYTAGVRAEKRREAEARRKEEDRAREELRREKEEREGWWEQLRSGSGSGSAAGGEGGSGGGSGGAGGQGMRSNQDEGGFDEDDFM